LSTLRERGGKSRSPLFERGAGRQGWWLRIHPKKVIADASRMNVKMQVRHLLVRAFAGGVPDAQAIARKGCIDGACYARDHEEDGGSYLIVGVPDISQMLPRNDEDMSWVELSQVEKGHGQVIVRNNARRQPAGDNVAEYASARRVSIHAMTPLPGGRCCVKRPSS
jgi:hypothetical protein